MSEPNLGFPRFQPIVMDILREEFGDDATIHSWVNDIDYRSYPYINVRRLGGTRDTDQPRFLDNPVIEMTVIHEEGLIEAEEMYQRALDALFRAWREQRVYEKGRLTYVRETMGMTQFSSLFQDTFRVQGLIALGIRPNHER